MVVGRCDVGPASAGEGPEDADSQNELRKSLAGPCCQDVPQCNEEESRAYMVVQTKLFLP